MIAPCKGIQGTLGFWIPRRGFRIPFTGFQIFLGGTWIPDSNCYWDSGFLHLYSGFQGPGFRIPQAKISKIPDTKCKNFPDSGIRIPLHGAKFSSGTNQKIVYPLHPNWNFREFVVNGKQPWNPPL